MAHSRPFFQGEKEAMVQTVESRTSAHIQVLANYIDGKWIEDPAAELLPVENPATGEVVARVPLSTPETVDRAARAAQLAFQEWRTVPPLERARFMYPLRDLLEKHR